MSFKITRRRLLGTSFIILGITFFKGIIDFLSSSTLGDAPTKDFFPVGDYPKGRVILGKRELTWLIHDDQGLFALDRRCTHLGCLVKWDEGEKRFLCPCHRSLYGSKGEVLRGPALKPLKYVYLKQDQAGNLIADLTKEVSREWRLKL